MALTNTQISQFFLATKGVAATGGTLSALKDLSKTAEISVLENSTSAYAAKDNADFVAGLYRDILNRDGSEDEIKAWSDAVAKFGGRAETLKAFTASVSANDKNAFESSNIDYVKGLYATYANDANPSQADLQAWAKFLNEGTTNRVDIVDLFVNTVKAEINTPHASGLRAYVNELIGDLYNNVLGRAATAGELTAWSNLWFDGKVDSLSGLIDLFNETASKASGDDKATYDNKMSFCESYGAACPNANQADATHCDASGITAETTDAAEQGKTNGEADEQSAPTPGGKDVFVTFDAINGDFADARETDDALVKYDENDPAAARIVAEKALKVATSEVTTNVSFDDSLSALKAIETVVIASDEKSKATVNADSLSVFKALKSIQDEAGATTVDINSNLKNLENIDLKAGADTLNIGESARLSALTTINLGSLDNSNDTLSIAKGARLDNLKAIVTGGGDDKVTIAGKVGADAGASLTIDLGAGDDTLEISVDQANAIQSGSGAIILGDGYDTLVLEGSKTAYSFNALSGIEGGKVVGAVAADEDAEGTKISVSGSSAFNASSSANFKAVILDIQNEVTFTNFSSSAATIDISDISGVKGNTNSIILDVSAASGSLASVIGTSDSNIVDILDLGGSSNTYSALEKIEDIDIVKTTRDEKTGVAETVTLDSGAALFDTNNDTAFELDGAIAFTVSAASSNSAGVDISLSNVFGNDNDDTIAITVVGNATSSKSGSVITLELDENDGINETISFSGFASTKAFDKVVITGLDNTDVIDLTNIASGGWTSSSSVASSQAVIVKDVDTLTEASAAPSKVWEALSKQGVTKLSGGAVVVADTIDGIGIYMASSTVSSSGAASSLKLIGLIGDDANIGNPTSYSNEATFSIA